MYVKTISAESFANLQCHQEYNYPIDSKKATSLNQYYINKHYLNFG